MPRLWSHMRTLWPRWTLFPAAPFVLWCSYCLIVRREARWELVAIMLGAPLLAYGSARTKRLFVGWLPFLLVGLLYDAMRFVQHVGVSASSVHICDLRRHELAFFGAWGRGPDGGPGTIHDWLQAHSSLVADVYFAIPYGIYIFVALGYGIYLAYTDHAALQRYGWAFFALNIVGFVTYHVYPAAPPWYFHAQGCAVDLGATASEGASLARVDGLLGIGYFHGLYGRSHDVFGAVPSLHVTYPVLMAWVGWSRHGWPVRALMLLYAASMIVGAVYLDHHWILDVVIGLAFVGVLYPATAALLGRRGELAVLAPTPIGPAPAPVPAARAPVLEASRESVQP